jgi:iron complex transport system permease protein
VLYSGDYSTRFTDMRKHPYLTSLVVLAAAVLLSIAVGSVFIPPADVLSVLWAGLTGAAYNGPSSTFATIVLELRLPRTALMALAGASLAGSGAAYQGLFRNPLADPYLIGVASGAGLGAVAAMSLHWPYTTLGLMGVPLCAFLGAVLTVGVVYLLARVGKSVPTTNLILAGVAVSAFTTALTSFMMINSSGEVRRALVWLLGGAAISGWGPVLGILPYAVIGLGALLTLGHGLNVLQFGEEQARQLGLRLNRVRAIAVIASSLATAAAVAFSGIIGFVGLIIPHITRRLWGGDMRRMLPLSMLCGGAFLVIADVLARVIMAPQELPVGIITALCGAPFFLFIMRQSKEGSW